MARPSTPEYVVKIIEGLWAEDDKQTALTVHSRAKALLPHGQCPAERKTQQIIRSARKRAGPIPDDPPLIPWNLGWPENAEDAACLFRLLRFYSLMSASTGLEWRLDTRTAKWALRLRAVFDVSALDLEGEVALVENHYLWASAYAERERAGEILKRPPYVADLDGAMQFRFWESESARLTYLKAVQLGVIPPYLQETDAETAETEFPGIKAWMEGMDRDLDLPTCPQGESDARNTEAKK